MRLPPPNPGDATVCWGGDPVMDSATDGRWCGWVGLLDGVNRPPSFTYLDSVSGLCDNITSRVVVDIFYAKAGLSHGIRLYVLAGAKITYVRWHLILDIELMHCHLQRNPDHQRFTIWSGILTGNDTRWRSASSGSPLPEWTDLSSHTMAFASQCSPATTHYQIATRY